MTGNIPDENVCPPPSQNSLQEALLPIKTSHEKGLNTEQSKGRGSPTSRVGHTRRASNDSAPPYLFATRGGLCDVESPEIRFVSIRDRFSSVQGCRSDQSRFQSTHLPERWSVGLPILVRRLPYPRINYTKSINVNRVQFILHPPVCRTWRQKRRGAKPPPFA